MPSLIGTTVTANYLKTTAPYTQFGTRNLQFIKVTLTGADVADFDLTVNSTASNSRLTRTVRSLQNVAELFAVFTPDSDELIVVVADQTANNGTATDWSIVEADIVSALKSEYSVAKTLVATVTTSAGFVGGAITFA